jgi:uncharacterized protein
MNVTVYADVEKFLARVMPLLQADEARNNLMLGVCLSISDYTNPKGTQPYLVCVLDGDTIVLASVMTPPFNLLLFSPLALPPDAALEALIEHLLESGRQIPGTHGEISLVSRFAHQYAARSGKQAHHSMSQKTYKLTEVTRTSAVPGAMRPAQAADLTRAVKLMTGFAEEALPNDPRDHIEKTVRRLIERSQVFLWEADGQPVSIASGNRPTPNGITISGVYTPPDMRGRGYASALVADLSQHFLDSGKQFCTLFTDLANPTSNHIYQQIGYRPVGDFSIYRFE